MGAFRIKASHEPLMLSFAKSKDSKRILVLSSATVNSKLFKEISWLNRSNKYYKRKQLTMWSRILFAMAAMLTVTVLIQVGASPVPDQCATTQENGMTVTRCSDGHGGTSESRQGGFSNGFQQSSSFSASSGHGGGGVGFQIPHISIGRFGFIPFFG